MITEAIREIRKTKAIPILIRLLKLAYNPAFVDKENFGLMDSCWNALTTIAEEHYQEVYEALKQERTYDKSRADIGISDIMKTIRDNQERTIDAPLDFETALILATTT